MFIYQRVSIYIIRDLRSFLLWWKSQHHLQIVTVQNKNNAFWNRWCSRIFHPCNLFPAMTLGRQYGDSMGEISWHLNRNVDTKRLIFNSMLIPGKKKQMSFSLNNSHRFSPKMGDFPMDWHNFFFSAELVAFCPAAKPKVSGCREKHVSAGTGGSEESWG
jgi:hypothetical protein